MSSQVLTLLKLLSGFLWRPIPSIPSFLALAQFCSVGSENCFLIEFGLLQLSSSESCAADAWFWKGLNEKKMMTGTNDIPAEADSCEGGMWCCRWWTAAAAGENSGSSFFCYLALTPPSRYWNSLPTEIYVLFNFALEPSEKIVSPIRVVLFPNVNGGKFVSPKKTILRLYW